MADVLSFKKTPLKKLGCSRLAGGSAFSRFPLQSRPDR